MILSIYNWTMCSARLLAFPSARLSLAIKIRIILLYAKIHIKAKLAQVFKIEFTSEKIFSMRFHFFNYLTFLYLFEEIFMQQTYYFEATQENPKILDVGSNVGLSVLYFKFLYPQSQIQGFEPDPDAFELLQKNIQSNRLTQVIVRQAAIADYDGQLSFYRGNKKGDLQAGMQSSEKSVQFSVPCFHLGRFIEGNVDFLKMDIEGAEGLVFNDLVQQKKLGQIQQLALECHHNHLDRVALAKILPQLESHHFRFQLSAPFRGPMYEKIPQDIMIYAHQEI